MKEVKSSKNNLLTESLITLAVGILFVTCSSFIAGAIGWIIGAVLTITGICAILVYFLSKKNQSAAYVVIGAILTAIGLFFLIGRESALKILPIAAGIVLVVLSSFTIISSIEMKKHLFPRWWVSLIFALIIAIAGLVLIFVPGLANEFVIIFIGASLIANSLFGILSFFMNKKANKGYYEVKYREVPEDTQNSDE